MRGAHGRVKPVDVRIQYEECIGIPERAEELSLPFLDRLAVETVGQPGTLNSLHIHVKSLISLMYGEISDIKLPEISYILLIFFSLARFVKWFKKNGNIKELQILDKATLTNEKDSEESIFNKNMEH